MFFEVGYWNEREQLEVPVVETEKRVFREEHPDMLMSMANLVSTYWNQGRWKEAEQQSSRCADEHGEPHVDVQQSGTVEGGKTAAGSSLGGEKDRRPHEKCCQSARQAPWTFMSL